jgi:uncharacterized protein (TIGR00730 family)
MTSRTAVVTVFGSSRPREGDVHYERARELGRLLAARGFLVCSGGYAGVMEAVSRGAKEAHGHTMAVTADFFAVSINAWVDEEVRVRTWEERLLELIRRGEGYIACPGGTGTLVELAVVWEMLNKSVMAGKPLVALGEFWRPIVERVREVETGQASPGGEGTEPLVHIATSPAEAAGYLAEKLLQAPRPAQPFS